MLIAIEITTDLRFDQIQKIRLGLIDAEMGSGQPVIYGLDPGQSVLEGVQASCSVPPWFAPIENEDEFIVNGGFMSNLPIEPALALSAIEIIALELVRPSTLLGRIPTSLGQFDRFISAISLREISLKIISER